MNDRNDDHPLRPTLAVTELQLQSALDQVCADKEIGDADTGELILMEESLAIATEAAKQAISIRKRIRADSRDEPPALA